MRKLLIAFGISSTFTQLSKTETSAARETIIDFHNYGKVKVAPIRKVGEVPRVELRSVQDGHLLLAVTPTRDKFYRVVEDMQSSIPLFGVMELQPITNQALLVVTKNYLATDCEYVPSLAAIVDGKLRLISPNFSSFFNRGGIGVKRNSTGNPTLYVWSERYQANDVHADGPSKFDLETFIFDRNRQMFVRERQSLVSTDDLNVPPSLLELFPHFTDC
jgi:hypothetical protein